MKIIHVVLTILICTGFLLASSENDGTTGLSFLKVGVNARAIGMGEAYTALANDASATYWNPAGLSSLKYSQVMFDHTEWILDVRSEFAAIAFAGKKSSWAFHIRSFSIADIPLRVDPSNDPLETFSANYLSVGATYSRNLSKKLSAGITAKYLFEKIYVESASGYAFDLGLIYKPTVKGLQVAAALQNAGKMNKLEIEETKLPVIARLGAAYELPVKSENIQALAVLDFVKPLEENLRVHIGTEVLVWEEVAIRLGYMNGYESRALTFGAGFLRSSIRFDYALTPFTDDLGMTHRFSVNFNL